MPGDSAVKNGQVILQVIEYQFSTSILIDHNFRNIYRIWRVENSRRGALIGAKFVKIR